MRLALHIHRPVLALVVLVLFSGAVTAAPYEFDGRIEAVQQADVYSRAEGIVEKVLVTQGDYVEAGTVLVRLRNDLEALRNASATASLAQAEALLTQARNKLSRAERLSSSGSVTEVTVLGARTELALAEAERDLAQHALDLAQTEFDDTFIRAPISGYIEDPKVRIGSLVEFSSGDPPLFMIVDLNPVRLIYEVPYAQRLSHAARVGSDDTGQLLATVELEVLATHGQTLTSGLHPTASSAWVDPETGTIRVWATIDNADGTFLPGMQVTVRSDMRPGRVLEGQSE